MKNKFNNLKIKIKKFNKNINFLKKFKVNNFNYYIIIVVTILITLASTNKSKVITNLQSEKGIIDENVIIIDKENNSPQNEAIENCKKKYSGLNNIKRIRSELSNYIDNNEYEAMMFMAKKYYYGFLHEINKKDNYGYNPLKLAFNSLKLYDSVLNNNNLDEGKNKKIKKKINFIIQKVIEYLHTKYSFKKDQLLQCRKYIINKIRKENKRIENNFLESPTILKIKFLADSAWIEYNLNNIDLCNKFCQEIIDFYDKKDIKWKKNRKLEDIIELKNGKKEKSFTSDEKILNEIQYKRINFILKSKYYKQEIFDFLSNKSNSINVDYQLNMHIRFFKKLIDKYNINLVTK